MLNEEHVIVIRRMRAKLMPIQREMPGTSATREKNKIPTKFDPRPYTVVGKHGNSLILESQEGAHSLYLSEHLSC